MLGRTAYSFLANPARQCTNMGVSLAAPKRWFSTPGKVKINLTTQDGTNFDLECPTGVSVMHAIRDIGKLEMMGMCDGKLECATCHARLSEKWFKKVAPPSDKEQDFLDQLDDGQPTSRLCCQITMSAETDGIEVSMEEKRTK